MGLMVGRCAEVRHRHAAHGGSGSPVPDFVMRVGDRMQACGSLTSSPQPPRASHEGGRLPRAVHARPPSLGRHRRSLASQKPDQLTVRPPRPLPGLGLPATRSAQLCRGPLRSCQSAGGARGSAHPSGLARGGPALRRTAAAGPQQQRRHYGQGEWARLTATERHSGPAMGAGAAQPARVAAASGSAALPGEQRLTVSLCSRFRRCPQILDEPKFPVVDAAPSFAKTGRAPRQPPSPCSRPSTRPAPFVCTPLAPPHPLPPRCLRPAPPQSATSAWRTGGCLRACRRRRSRWAGWRARSAAPRLQKCLAPWRGPPCGQARAWASLPASCWPTRTRAAASWASRCVLAGAGGRAGGEQWRAPAARGGCTTVPSLPHPAAPLWPPDVCSPTSRRYAPTASSELRWHELAAARVDAGV